MTDGTASQHPFLNEDFAIRWSTLLPDAIEPDISQALEDASAAIQAIIESPQAPSYENTYQALEQALERLQHAWGMVGHLDSVCNSPELRAAYNAMLPKVSAFFAKIPLNEGLWQALKAFGEVSDQSELTPTKRRHVAETMADFREQGADLPPEQKKRAAEIQQRLSELTQKYSENCLDATNAWEEVVTDEESLSGLPDSALAAARQSAQDKGHKAGWRFTLQAPSFIPVMTHADNDELRREVWQAYSNVGRMDPCDNQPIVPEILRLRHEFAQLIGQENFADHVTARRMTGSGQAALDFTDRLHGRLVQAFEQETQALRTFKAETTNTPLDLLEPWETAYWAEKMRRAEYDFDEEALRPYFPIDRVISGLFDIAGTLFDIRIEERTGVETWHPEVTFYELFDATTDELLGAFYADWHPRESKRGGAWMNFLATGSREGAKRSPHLGLICGNLSPAVEGKPALLSHREVETIFHEFGHLLHHLCGEVEVKSLNGVNVAWDFVELPSQIMENWCWERTSLDRFARHYETGEVIPDKLFEKMMSARNFRKADTNVRQLAFGKMDLDLHIHWPTAESADLEAFVRDHLHGYRAEYKTEPPTNVFHFGHLFSDPTGYAAGYYSYKWAEVLDADAFSRFREEGVLNPKTGADFRHTILARGNAAPPAELFRDFMGRDPDPEALLCRDGLESSL
jgi:oligopeptidase A